VNCIDHKDDSYSIGPIVCLQDPFSDVESDEDSEIEMLECAEDAEMDDSDGMCVREGVKERENQCIHLCEWERCRQIKVCMYMHSCIHTHTHV